MKKYRVVHICQIGKVSEPFIVYVSSVKEGIKVMNMLADYDLYQLINHIKPDYSNASFLEEYDEEENEWFDWMDELGDTASDILRELRNKYSSEELYIALDTESEEDYK